MNWTRLIQRLKEMLKGKHDVFDETMVHDRSRVVSMETGDSDGAIQELTLAIQHHPDHVAAYLKRAEVYAEREDFDNAIADVMKVRQLAPETVPVHEVNQVSASLYFMRGINHLEKGEFNAAIQDFTEAIQLRPDHAAIYRCRGTAYFGTKDFDEAIQDYQRTIEIELENNAAYDDNDDAHRLGFAYAGRANTYLEAGDFDTAIQDYHASIAIDPDRKINYTRLESAYRARAAAYLENDDFQNAIEDWSKGREVYLRTCVSSDHEIYVDSLLDRYCKRAEACVAGGAFDKVIQGCRKIIALNLSHLYHHCVDVYKARAEAYLEDGDFDNAIQAYNCMMQCVEGISAESVKETLSEMFYQRALTYHKQGEVQRVIGVIKALTAPTQGTVNANAAAPFHAALQDYANAIEHNPKHADAYYYRGRVYEATGEVYNAIQDFTDAILYAQPSGYRSLSVRHRRLGDPLKVGMQFAIGGYSEVIKRQPDAVYAYYFRGVASLKTDAFNTAIEDLSEVIERLPSDTTIQDLREVIGYATQELKASENAHYFEALLRNLDAPYLYHLRAEAYTRAATRNSAIAINLSYDRYIKHWTTAIDRNPEDAYAYVARAEVYLRRQAWKKAKFDLTASKKLGMNISEAFRTTYGTIATFEQRFRVQIPSGIAAMLTED